VVAGGERPDEGRRADEAANGVIATSVRPASARLTCPRAGWSLVGSAEVPTWQTPQWVLVFTWQARSWCPNGRVASAATYAAMTNLRITPSRRREVPTYRVYGDSARGYPPLTAAASGRRAVSSRLRPKSGGGTPPANRHRSVNCPR
jgi:hypothetical protein